MFVYSSYSETNARGKAHVFTNFGPYEKPKKLEWEFNWIFQDVLATKLPWVEMVIDLNGKLSMVKCRLFMM
jgi:hypothetical protein